MLLEMSSKRDLNKFYFNELHDLVAKPPADSKYLMVRMKGTYRKDDGWCLSIELNWKKKKIKISDNLQNVIVKFMKESLWKSEVCLYFLDWLLLIKILSLHLKVWEKV